MPRLDTIQGESLQCLICGKQKMESDSSGPEPRTPHPVFPNGMLHFGVYCETSGNYGSRVLDMHGTYFFAICDYCLVERSYRAYMLDWNKRPSGKIRPEEEVVAAGEHYDEWLDWLKAENEKDGDRGTYYKDFAKSHKKLKRELKKLREKAHHDCPSNQCVCFEEDEK
jgi:hypothetical protein